LPRAASPTVYPPPPNPGRHYVRTRCIESLPISHSLCICCQTTSRPPYFSRLCLCRCMRSSAPSLALPSKLLGPRRPGNSCPARVALLPHPITWRCPTTRWSHSASLRDASQSPQGSSTDAASRALAFGAILALVGWAAPPQGCSVNLEAVRRPLRGVCRFAMRSTGLDDADHFGSFIPARRLSARTGQSPKPLRLPARKKDRRPFSYRSELGRQLVSLPRLPP